MEAARSIYSQHQMNDSSSNPAANQTALSGSQTRREQSIRTWIARNESVCPYAPGLAKFTHLPPINKLDHATVRYLAEELKDFYQTEERGERVGRWMLLPAHEWTSHAHAKEESQKLFWGLLGAFYLLRNDRRKMGLALNRILPGYSRDHSGDIGNPVVGILAKANQGRPHPKSLFCTAMSRLYHYEHFYRYAPASMMVLVYASDFCEAQKNEKAVRKINLNMTHSNLIESFGADIEIDMKALRNELPLWEQIIAQVVYNQQQIQGRCLNSEVMDRFNSCPDFVVEQTVQMLSKHRLTGIGQSLNILKRICAERRVTAKQVLSGHFSGAGLYATPNYY